MTPVNISRWFGNRPLTRPLARPEEDIEDQGLAFDVQTLREQRAFSGPDRRQVLSALGLGAAGLGLAACAPGTETGTAASSSSSTTPSASSTAGLTEIPDETAGPYPGDGSNGPDVLEETGVVRSDLRTSFGEASGTAEGVPMTLELTILDLANGGAPFAGVAVYVWHCDREGRYSMYSEGVEEENYLRGVQIADADGKVRFTSIFPACYTGRWPHIHFEVYPDQDSIADSANAICISQVALPQNVCDAVYATAGYESSVQTLAGVTLSSDNVFGDDGGAQQLGAVTGDTASGYHVTLTVPVDVNTAVSSGNAPSGGAPGAGGPGGGTPPQG